MTRSRKIILILWTICCGFCAVAQNIIYAEYYWDTDPGFNSGTSISISAPDTLLTLNVPIPTSGLSPGIHHLFIRTLDDQGNWSMPINKLYYIDNTSKVPLSYAEYFWDTDQGFGSGTSISISTPDSLLTLNVPIPTSGLSPGIHHLFIRTLDDLGNWSMPINKLYYIDNTSKVPITYAEYFWDTDPGFGNGQQITFNPSDTSVGQVLSLEAPDTMSNGIHQLYLRVYDSIGNWSIYLNNTIYLGDSIFVDESAGGLNNGGSWSDAFTDLQSALHAAPTGSIILIAEGTYRPDQGTDSRDSSFVMKEHLRIVGGFPAGGDSVSNPELYPTILSGNIGAQGDSTDNSYHVVISENVGDDLRVENLTIQGGYLNGGTTNYGGGGWFNRASAGLSSPKIINCQFKNNYAQFHGGAFASLAWTNGITEPKILGCLFENNQADDGGAISSVVDFDETVNSYIENCIFYQNEAIDFGGAIYHYTNNNSTHKQINCVFYENKAAKGGAVSHYESPNGEYINCSFSRNSSTSYGGHLDVDIDYYYSYDLNIHLKNCIIGEEHPMSNGPYITSSMDQVFVEYSLIYTNLNAWTSDEGNNIQNTDPKFIDEPNGDVHIRANSQAVNRGSNLFNVTPTDPDDNPRIKHGKIDMGAYEVQADTCKGTININGQYCNDPYLVDETITLNVTSSSGPGPFTLSLDGTIYSNVTSGQNLISLTEGIDFSGVLPYTVTFTLDSIKDIDGHCIPQPGDLVVTKSAEFADSIRFSFTSDHSNPTVCLGEDLSYTINISGGTGEYLYRFSVDENYDGQYELSELRTKRFTTDTSVTWTGIIEYPEHVVAIFVKDRFASCNNMNQLDTHYVDSFPPTAKCNDITIVLDASEFVVLTGIEFDDGSSDSCGIVSWDINRSTYSCADQGDHDVVITITNIYGLTDTSHAVLTIQDTSDFCKMNCTGLVTTTAEFGPGSLYHEIHCPNPIDTITFAPWLADSTIVISSNPISIFKDILIIYSDHIPNDITIDVSELSTFLTVENYTILKLEGLNIISPENSPSEVINNYGNLTLKDMNIYYLDSPNGVEINNQGELTILGESNIRKN